jgi:hypothetical protein
MKQKIFKREPKYLKFEYNAVICIDKDEANSEKPLKDLKLCTLCTFSFGKPVYHFNKSVADSETKSNEIQSSKTRNLVRGGK